MSRAPEAPRYSDSLALSLAVHALLLALFLLIPRLMRWAAAPASEPLEIEITSPFLGDGPAKLGAPKALTPGFRAKVNATAEKAPETVAPPKPPEKAPQPPKDWVLPGPQTKVVEKPEAPAATGAINGTGTQTTPGGAPGGEGTAAKTGGEGEGSDEGVVGGRGHGGTPLLAFPKLLNRDEVLENLRRLYPEIERRAGREADVIIMIHIGVDGSVRGVDLQSSSGANFDEAARKVGKLMRFSPAIGLNGRPVPVRMGQPINFRLTN